MALSGPGFDLADFLGAISATVRPGTARPVVVHAAELETLPAGQVHNPTTLAIAGRLPTATFELFRQTIPPGESSDMQRHYHETVHYVISGRGHSDIEDDAGAWAAATSSTRRRGPGTATTTTRPASRPSSSPSRTPACCRPLGISRRQSAGLCTVAEARARFPEDHSRQGQAMSDLPEHISIWGELADVDHELRHVDVGGVRTRVLRAGSGPDLVLLHGTGGHLEAYARDIAGLAADFRVTAYDMVGHGWSDLPDRPYTIDVLCDHLIGLLDALDIDAAHLSGESLGGWVAAWAAAHHPDRVGRLVLNTPGNIANKPEVMARLRESTLAAVRDPSDATVRRRVEFLFHHTEMVTDELVTLRRAVYSRPGFLRAISNTLVLQDPEVRKDFAWDPGWVGKITAPTLLLWTDHDPTGGLDEAALLLDWLPDARLYVIADAGPLAAVGEARASTCACTGTSCCACGRTGRP